MAVRLFEVKKKSIDIHRVPSDGLTGMGHQTKIHFVDVKKRMDDYLAQQQDFEQDRLVVHRDKPPTKSYFPDGRKPIPSSSTRITLPNLLVKPTSTNFRHKKPTTSKSNTTK